MKNQPATFKEFKVENRIKVNHYLNYVLWFFGVASPGIASGLKAGFFKDITYFTCINIFVIVVFLSSIHLILCKKTPSRLITTIFALTAVDVLLVYMTISHVNVYLTWFLVPLLSLLFCDFYIFGYAMVLNTVLMITATVLIAPYRVLLRTDYDSVGAYLADTLGGFAIETFAMFVSGFIILKITVTYLSEMFRQNEIIAQNEQSMKEEMDILSSMAEIYDNVNIIDLTDYTEISLRDPNRTKRKIDINSQTHTLVNQKMQKQIMPDQLGDFLRFTNITTLKDRLTNRKVISAEFSDVVLGWFRAQYITVDSAPDGTPNIIIYTTRNVDEEKRREEHLIRISMTDNMTRLYNRRCYEEELNEYRRNALPDDFVLFLMDVNGLKKANDTKGHVAGDELIKGAAECISLSVGENGKVYRTGGDEFIAVVHTIEPEDIRSRIIKKATEWHGIYVDELTVSVGYAAKKDYPDAKIDDLEHIADANMYFEKEKFYKEVGLDRRK